MLNSLQVMASLISMTSSRFGWLGGGFVDAGSIQDVVQARPLLVNAKNVLFEAYDASLQKNDLRSVEAKSNFPTTAKQYLIRVQEKKKSQVYKELLKFSEYVQYLAYDTFLAPLTEKEMEAVMQLEGVHTVAFHLPSAMKMTNEMAAFIASDSSADASVRTLDSKSVTIIVVIVAQFSPEDLLYICRDYEYEVCRVREVTPGRTLAIDTNVDNKRSILLRCQAHPMVRWLEEKVEAREFNKFASGIIQGNGESVEQRHPFWEKGLTGDGEIIGAAPSRINFHKGGSCSRPFISFQPEMTLLLFLSQQG
jgi:hypothetical protein